jgi:microcystin-dependent protein
MSDQYLGEIRMFTGNFAPEGWLFCNGQVLNISQYDALFSLIGTFYGGDGISTFALPDLRGRNPLHNGTASSGITYNLGQMGGLEQVTLSTSELPTHTHTVNALSSMGTTASPSNAFWAGSTIVQYSTITTNGVMGSQAISVTGGSTPHNNMMPFLAISFIIATSGIFPSSN